jgi:SAM-dependent methyltransferase
VRAALQRAAGRYRGVPPRVALYARIKYFVDPGYLRAAEVITSLDPASRRTVLDLGCGIGMLSVLLGEAAIDADVQGLDWDEGKLRWARTAARGLPRLEFRAANLLETTLPSADCAVLLDVLHYHPTPSQDALLERVAGALSPVGTMLIRETDADHQRAAARFFERLAAGLGWHRTGGRFHYRSCSSLVGALDGLGFDARLLAAGDLVHRGNVLIVATRRCVSRPERGPCATASGAGRP